MRLRRRRRRSRAPTGGPSSKAIFWLVLAVLAFHSFIAKPFYIPSESMMPGLLKGDRLVVTKYPYGWSWVEPELPRPAGDDRAGCSAGCRERGDVVIVTPPGETSDYIKRVIGLPGDTIQMVNGQRHHQRQAGEARAAAGDDDPDRRQSCRATDHIGRHRVAGPDGKLYCRLPVVRETLPNGRGLRHDRRRLVGRATITARSPFPPAMSS